MLKAVAKNITLPIPTNLYKEFWTIGDVALQCMSKEMCHLRLKLMKFIISLNMIIL